MGIKHIYPNFVCFAEVDIHWKISYQNFITFCVERKLKFYSKYFNFYEELNHWSVWLFEHIIDVWSLNMSFLTLPVLPMRKIDCKNLVTFCVWRKLKLDTKSYNCYEDLNISCLICALDGCVGTENTFSYFVCYVKAWIQQN